MLCMCIFVMTDLIRMFGCEDFDSGARFGSLVFILYCDAYLH